MQLEKFQVAPELASQIVSEYDYFWRPPPWSITDPQNHIVEGYASMPNLDDQNDVVPITAIEAALPAFMEWGNLREMHSKGAAGKVLAARVDESGLWIKASVEDPVAWAKVQSGTYQGFSIGGDVTDSQTGADGVRVITAIRLNEISLVDRPANPRCRISVVKFAESQQKNHIVTDAPVREMPEPQPAEKAQSAQGPPPIIHNTLAMNLNELNQFRATLADPEDIAAIDKALSIVQKANGNTANNVNDEPDAASEPAEKAKITDAENESGAGVGEGSGHPWADGSRDVDEKDEDDAQSELDVTVDHTSRWDFVENKAAGSDKEADKDDESRKAAGDEAETEKAADFSATHRALGAHLAGAMQATNKVMKAISASEDPTTHVAQIKAHLTSAQSAHHSLGGADKMTKAAPSQFSPAVVKALEARVQELESDMEFMARKTSNSIAYLSKTIAGLPGRRPQAAAVAQARDEETEDLSGAYRETATARRRSMGR